MAKRGKSNQANPAKAARAQAVEEQRRVEALSRLHEAFTSARDAEDWPAALSAVEKLRDKLPHSPELKFAHAKLLFDHFSEIERPITLIEQAIPELQSPADAFELLSSILLARGDMEAAKAAAIAAIERCAAQAVAYINLIKIDKAAAAAFEPKICGALRAGGLDPLKTAFLLNALGRLREAAQDYEGAWKCFAAAKAGAPCRQMDMDGSEAVVHEARAVFTPAFFSERRQWGVKDDRPVFVVGLPRSGTTLVERILAAHPDVAAAGELHFISQTNIDMARRAVEISKRKVGRYAHLLELTGGAARKAAENYLTNAQRAAGDAGGARIVDKMPSNFAHLGLIALLFPKARIIHVARNPLDVFLSSFKEMFRNPQPHTYDPMKFAHYAILHEELMAHWRSILGERILNVKYEEIVADTEGEARRMVAHLGLEWDAACAAPHEASGQVMTASAAQVREPVHQRSVDGWRRYEAQLAPLRDVLERYFALTRDAA